MDSQTRVGSELGDYSEGPAHWIQITMTVCSRCRREYCVCPPGMCVCVPVSVLISLVRFGSSIVLCPRESSSSRQHTRAHLRRQHPTRGHRCQCRHSHVAQLPTCIQDTVQHTQHNDYVAVVTHQSSAQEFQHQQRSAHPAFVKIARAQSRSRHGIS